MHEKADLGSRTAFCIKSIIKDMEEFCRPMAGMRVDGARVLCQPL